MAGYPGHWSSGVYSGPNAAVVAKTFYGGKVRDGKVVSGPGQAEAPAPAPAKPRQARAKEQPAKAAGPLVRNEDGSPISVLEQRSAAKWARRLTQREGRRVVVTKGPGSTWNFAYEEAA
jgi:hypothetical protein